MVERNHIYIALEIVKEKINVTGCIPVTYPLHLSMHKYSIQIIRGEIDNTTGTGTYPAMCVLARKLK